MIVGPPLSIAAIDATEPLIRKCVFEELAAQQRGQMLIIGEKAGSGLLARVSRKPSHQLHLVHRLLASRGRGIGLRNCYRIVAGDEYEWDPVASERGCHWIDTLLAKIDVEHRPVKRLPTPLHKFKRVLNRTRGSDDLRA
jgi:hypothetical protein